MALLLRAIGVGVMQYFIYCARNSASVVVVSALSVRWSFCGRKLEFTSDTVSVKVVGQKERKMMTYNLVVVTADAGGIFRRLADWRRRIF